jgi:hypothetical protein
MARNKSATILQGWPVENRVFETTNRPKTGQAEQVVTRVTARLFRSETEA